MCRRCAQAVANCLCFCCDYGDWAPAKSLTRRIVRKVTRPVRWTDLSRCSSKRMSKHIGNTLIQRDVGARRHALPRDGIPTSCVITYQPGRNDQHRRCGARSRDAARVPGRRLAQGGRLLTTKRGLGSFRVGSVQRAMKRIKSRGVPAVVFEPSLDAECSTAARSSTTRTPSRKAVTLPAPTTGARAWPTW